MAIFTAIAAAIGLTGFFASAFVTVASIVTSIGLSYAAKALSGNQSQPAAATANNFGLQGTIAAAGDVPRSFNLGYSATAGSLVYANTVKYLADTPNAYLMQVIALADLPGGTLREVWINGELGTLGTMLNTDLGPPVLEYRKGSVDHLWVKYHDGTQTTADSFLVAQFAADTNRPYQSTRIGKGVAYVIVSALTEDTLFTGFPAFKFALSGIPLYDPSKDSTVGGSGSHVYSNPATWGGDGDNFPAVQAYNILRGFYYGGVWLYGLQGMSASRLPATNWIAQIAKCRSTITGPSGAEATYRSGGQINVNTQAANAIETLLTACQGRLSEIGGFYKIHLGPPDSPTFSFTDDDILSTEQQVYRPFFALADSVNGIQATYPDPAQGWNTATAPAYYRTDLEAKDGNRRLMASPAFDFVPYTGQVQRLMKSAIQEAQRARTHLLVMPPAFWIVEPGDVGQWTSVRNGYSSKQFRVDAAVDKYNLDVGLNLTEVDPTDYSWNQGTDFTSVVTGPTIIARPAPQGVLAWAATGVIIYDSNGIGRRPAIRLAWDGNQPSIVGITWQVRLTADGSVVTSDSTDQFAVGAVIISQSLLPNTAYQVRGQYLPSWPRDMLWSSWLDVTTPDVSISLLDFDAAVRAQVTIVTDYLNDRLSNIEQRFADITSTNAATAWLDKKEVRSQLSSTYQSNLAFIETVQTAYTSADTALATSITTVSASVGSISASVTANTSAISTLNGYAAAKYSVTLDVNGYASGFTLLNGGASVSSATFLVDKFQVAAPGVSGGAAVPIFTVANVSGSPKIALRGDMYVDGTIAGTMIAAGTITAVKIATGTLTATQIAAGAINTASLAINSVDILNIIDGAASNTDAATGSCSPVGGYNTVVTKSFSVQNGRVVVLVDLQVNTPPPGFSALSPRLKIDGSVVKTVVMPQVATGGSNYPPLAFMYYATGLSAASHTFLVEIDGAAGAAADIVLLNPRR